MQEDFRMGEDHQQRFLLCQRPPFAFVQLVVAAGLLEEPFKLSLQSVSLGLVGMVPIVQQVAVQFPEALREGVQCLAVGRQKWAQLLVMAIFMDPAER